MMTNKLHTKAQLNTTITEICRGSYYDAIQAVKGGAERIELNTALALGGLTPTTATLRLIKEQAPSLQVIAMVRPRGAGFCYTEDEFTVMEAECEQLLQNGTVDRSNRRHMIKTEERVSFKKL